MLLIVVHKLDIFYGGYFQLLDHELDNVANGILIEGIDKTQYLFYQLIGGMVEP